LSSFRPLRAHVSTVIVRPSHMPLFIAGAVRQAVKEWTIFLPNHLSGLALAAGLGSSEGICG